MQFSILFVRPNYVCIFGTFLSRVGVGLFITCVKNYRIYIFLCNPTIIYRFFPHALSSGRKIPYGYE